MSLYSRFPSLHSCLKSKLPITYTKTLTTLASLSNPKKQKVIVISGTTCAGKTQLALELAKRLNGEIISADSVQVYKGLDIGSAKPSVRDRADIAHHLLDIMHPTEEYSAGQFFNDARVATKDVLNRGCVPIVTGGTGLYLRWYIYGKPGVPEATQEAATSAWSELEKLQAEGDWDKAVDLVNQSGDPTAGTVPVNNWYRLRRKLEILKASNGSPTSSFKIPYDEFCTGFDANNLDYEFVCIFLTCPRIGLYRSIDFRCEEMIMDGLLNEASYLLDIGLKPNISSATRAIGYRQAMEYLSFCRQNGGRSSADEFYAFLSQFQKASRNFAKRQMTWFRNERIYKWVDGSGDFEEILGFICKYYKEDGFLDVPKGLEIAKESSERREINELKKYRSENRLFVKYEDFEVVLDWIHRTQGSCSEVRL